MKGFRYAICTTKYMEQQLSTKYFLSPTKKIHVKVYIISEFIKLSKKKTKTMSLITFSCFNWQLWKHLASRASIFIADVRSTDMCLLEWLSPVCSSYLVWFLSVSSSGKLSDFGYTYYLAGNYLFKFKNRNSRTRCEICSKLTIDTRMTSMTPFWCLYC